MYQNKVVAVVKAGGKVLRERDGEVFLPFGSEYSILIKNLHPVRIKVKVSADGQDVTEGVWLIVEPNSSLELERFIRNGDLEKGNRLKFIERTDEIEEYRGIRPDDGLVRVEYKVEQQEIHVPVKYDYYYDWWYRPFYPRRRWSDVGHYQQTTITAGSTGGVQCCAVNMSMLKQSVNSSNDAGITVPGSESQQQFYSVLDFKTSEAGVIVLRLRGLHGSGETMLVEKAVTVEQKSSCSTCGKSNSPDSKFCSKCGTSLVLY